MRTILIATLCLLLAVPAAAGKKKKIHKKAPPAAAAPAKVHKGAAAAKDPDAEKKARAQKLVGEARALFDKGVFPEAGAKFEEAYRLFPVPKMLYNLGLTYDALHKDDRAVCALERFVAEVPDADPTLKTDAEERIGRLKPRIGRIEVEAPAGAVLFLDGEERATAPAAVPICSPEGKHRVVAVLGGAAPVGIDLAVAAGATLKVALDPATNSAKLVSDSAAAAVVIATPPPPPPPVESKPVWKKWWFWTAVGVVAAGAVTTGVVLGTRPSDVTPPASDYGPFPVFQ